MFGNDISHGHKIERTDFKPDDCNNHDRQLTRSKLVTCLISARNGCQCWWCKRCTRAPPRLHLQHPLQNNNKQPAVCETSATRYFIIWCDPNRGRADEHVMRNITSGWCLCVMAWSPNTNTNTTTHSHKDSFKRCIVKTVNHYHNGWSRHRLRLKLMRAKPVIRVNFMKLRFVHHLKAE